MKCYVTLPSVGKWAISFEKVLNPKPNPSTLNPKPSNLNPKTQNPHPQNPTP